MTMIIVISKSMVLHIKNRNNSTYVTTAPFMNCNYFADTVKYFQLLDYPFVLIKFLESMI